ncbi:MAG: heme o synthase [Actinomycetota bacterium]
MKTFRRLSLATTVATILVIAIGGYVRSSGSGDGCPDWPKCFGKWYPPLDFHAIVEYTHRYAGAIAIGLLIATAVVGIRRHRSDPRLLWPTLVAAFAILMQAGLGGIVVAVKERAKTDPSFARFEGPLVTFHIATAMILIAMLVLITIRAWRLEVAQPMPIVGRRTQAWLAAAAGSVYALILVGAYMRGEHASLAFTDWPLMDGSLLPRLDGRFGIHFAHRAAAGLTGLVVLGATVHVYRRVSFSHVRRLTFVAAAAFAIQVVVGGLQVLTTLAPVPVALHVLLSALIWASLVGAWSLSRPLARAGAVRAKKHRRSFGAAPDPAPISGAQVGLAVSQRNFSSTLGAYVALTKPRIILLLLITTVPAMVLAAGGMPSLGLIGATLLGGTLAAGSANTINMIIDRDIDALMSRTRRRPLPTHLVTPERALIFAMSLAAISFWFMTATVNLTAALLAQSAIAFYVFVYTLLLKRSTPQNIVIGGAAGAVPALVGWAGVTGTLHLEAWLLFMIIFAWTPPHFWALAIRYSKDYEAAGVPMLPVVAGRERTERSILRYTVATVALSLGLWGVADLGPLYGVAAIGLGAWFLRDAWRIRRGTTVASAMAVFKTSIIYLGLLFPAVAADVLVMGALR